MARVSLGRGATAIAHLLGSRPKKAAVTPGTAAKPAKAAVTRKADVAADFSHLRGATPPSSAPVAPSRAVKAKGWDQAHARMQTQTGGKVAGPSWDQAAKRTGVAKP